jgi:hypothetical protein
MIKTLSCTCSDKGGGSRSRKSGDNLLIARETGSGLGNPAESGSGKHRTSSHRLKNQADRRMRKTPCRRPLQKSLLAFEEARTRIQKNKAAHLAIDECNLAITGATDELSFLKSVCQIVTEIGGFAMAWFGYIKPGKGREILYDSENTFCCRTPKRGGFTSSIAIPVYVAGQMLGALNVCRCSTCLFEPESTGFLAAIAEMLGSGIAKIRRLPA